MLQRRPFRPLGKRLVAVALAMVMTAAVALPSAFAVTQEDINNLKSKASDLASQKASLQTQIDKVANSKNSAVQQKQLLEQKINVLREEIEVSEQAIAEYAEMISQKEVELAEAQEKEEEYYELFLTRVRSMEEQGTVSYWSILFNASSFADLLDRVNQIAEIAEYDNGVMDALAEARQAVADAKSALEESKAGEEETKANLTAQKADLSEQEAQVDALIAQLNAQSDTYASQMEELQSDANSIASQITQAEKQYAAEIAAAKKAAEEAAAKKAAEEAAAKKKAEEEAAKKAAAAAAASSSSSSSSSSTTTTTTTTTTTGSGGFIWPLSGYSTLSSSYGYRNCPYHGNELHGGVDIPAPSGTPIKAAKSGVVIISGYGSSYGNYIVIAHGDGTRTLYAHQSSRAVSAGASVSQGQTIGYVGSTGSSTGNHLHFEIWTGSSSSSRVNPMSYF